MSRTHTGRRIIVVLVWAGLIQLAGCATTTPRADGDRAGMQQKGYLQAWKDASRKQADDALADDAKPAPEPKLLPMTHFSAGALYEKQGCLPKAIEQYQKAVELNPQFSGAHARLGLCYTKMGQFRFAIEALTRAAEQQPRSATIWNNLGFAQLAAGNPIAAQASLAKALAIAPTYGRSRTNMAMALVRQGRDNDALSNLETVAPDYIALYDLGSMQMATGRCQEAKASFDKALAVRSEFPAAQKALEQAIAKLPAAPATQPTGTAALAPATRPSTAIAEATPLPCPAPAIASTPEAPAALAQAPATQPVQLPAAPAVTAWKQIEPGPLTVHDIAMVSMEPADAMALIETMTGWNQLPFIVDQPQDAQETAAAPAGSPAAEPVAAPVDSPRQAAVAGLLLCPPSLSAGSLLAGREGLGWIDPTVAMLLPNASKWHCQIEHDLAMQRQVAPVTSVADVDLVSLEWFAWCQTMDTLHADVQDLSPLELVPLMRKWMTLMDHMRDTWKTSAPAIAMAE